MKNNAKIFLLPILDSIEKIEDITARTSKDYFLKNCIVIGEAEQISTKK